MPYGSSPKTATGRTTGDTKMTISTALVTDTSHMTASRAADFLSRIGATFQKFAIDPHKLDGRAVPRRLPSGAAGEWHAYRDNGVGMVSSFSQGQYFVDQNGVEYLPRYDEQWIVKALADMLPDNADTSDIDNDPYLLAARSRCACPLYGLGYDPFLRRAEWLARTT